MHITITGSRHYMGMEAYRIGDILSLKKDHDDHYDDEAIKVYSENGVIYGCVANSVDSVARGTHSAGYIYNSIKEEARCKILFVIDDSVIAELLEE